MVPIVIAENAPEIGADTATSLVPANYQGPCAVVEASGRGLAVAVLPSSVEAYRVARYAITPDGGYGSVMVEMTERCITDQNFEDWLWGSSSTFVADNQMGSGHRDSRKQRT